MTVSNPESGSITMFSTSWCGYCRRLKSQLDREGIPFTEVDIERDPESARFVEKVNRGNQTVPDDPLPRRVRRHEPQRHRGQAAPRRLTYLVSLAATSGT